MSHLIIFGCIVHALIGADECNKMDKKSGKYIFIGFSDESKGYHFYNLETKMLLIHQDIIFYKHSCWNWSKAQHQIEFSEISKNQHYQDKGQ